MAASAFGKALTRVRSVESLFNRSAKQEDQDKTIVPALPKTPVIQRIKTGIQNRLDSLKSPKSSDKSIHKSASTSILKSLPFPLRPSRAKDTENRVKSGKSTENSTDISRESDQISVIERKQLTPSKSQINFQIGDSDLIRSGREIRTSPIETGILGRTTADQSLEESIQSPATKTVVDSWRDLKEKLEREENSGTPERSIKRNLFPTRDTVFSRPSAFPSAFTSTPKPGKQITFHSEISPIKERRTMAAKPWNEIDPQIVKMLPTFSGEGGEQFMDYLDRYHRHINCYGLGEIKAYKALPLLLTGRAERAYTEIEKEGKVYDYASLQQKLMEKLSTKESIIRAKFDKSIAMKETETLPEYAARVHRNYLAAYPDMKEDAQQRMMADAFAAGVTPDIRFKLMKENHKTLNAALEMAEQLKTYNELSTGGVCAKSIAKEVTAELKKAKLEEITEPAVNYLDRNRDYNSFRGGNNQFQRRMGNDVRDNRRSFNDRREYDKRESRPRDLKEIRCYNCQNFGHYANNCSYPDKRRTREFNGFSAMHDRRPSSRERQGSYSRNQSQESEDDYDDHDERRGGSRDHSRDREDYERNQGGKRSVRFSRPFINTLFMVVSLCTLFMPGSAEKFWKCEKHETAAIMFTQDESMIPCKSSFNNKAATLTKSIIYKRDQIAEPISAFGCSIVHHESCVKSISKIFNLSINVTTIERPVTVDECLKMERTKVSKSGNLTEVKHGLWKSDISVPKLPMYGMMCSTQTSYVLQYGAVFELKKGVPVSTIGSLFGCQLEKGMCENSNQTIIWRPNDKIIKCPHAIGHHDVIISDSVILIPSLEKILYPLSHEMHRDDCSKTYVLKTSEFFEISFPEFQSAKSLYEITGKANEKIFVRSATKLKDNPSHYSINHSERIITEFSPLAEVPTTKSSVNNQYVNMETELGKYDINRVYLDICEQRKDKKRQLLLEMQLYPTKIIQQLLGRFDIAAEIIDKEIYSISLCEGVFPSEIKENRRILTGNGYNCHVYLPIVVNGTEMFVDEETMHVHDSSPITTCDGVNGKGKRDETMSKMRLERNHQLRVQSIPSSTNTSTIPILGFMESKTLDSFKNVSTSLWDRIKQKVENIKNRGVAVAKLGSSAVVNFAVEVKDKVFEFTSGWLKFIRNIMIGLLISATVILILYLMVKYYWKEIISCGIGCCCGNLRRAVSEPRVNYILRRRESSEIMNPQDRYSRFVHEAEQGEEMELITYNTRGVTRKPMLRSVDN